MKYILTNENDNIKGIFDREITTTNKNDKLYKIKKIKNENIIGKKIGTMNPKEMKIAIICNWRTPCGISTYSKYLFDALKNKVKEIKIFSEIEEKADTSCDNEENVTRCWKRGENLKELSKQIKEYKPTFVLIQHEFGIFPKATHYLKFIQELENIPYAVVLHSVYESHLDKTIFTSVAKNIIVHSKSGCDNLIKLGHTNNNICVIPHGCIEFDDIKELWNTFQTPYAIVQFGFGFFYKGVDRAIEAIGILKKRDPKFKDIFYCYLCSESANAKGTHCEYQEYLETIIEKFDLYENVAIIRKYNSDEIINNYLRTAKLALFPYVTNPNNIVFGASGAIRIAMANNCPTIASESHMFDDLENIVPKPKNAEELANEIDKIFSDEQYKTEMLEKFKTYIKENNWNNTALKYIEYIKNVLKKENIIEIY